MKLISVFGPFRVLRAPLYTHFFTHWNSGLWHFIWKVLLKEKQWVDKRGNPWYWYQFLTLLGSSGPHFIPIFVFIQVRVCETSFDRYFWKKNDGVKKKRKLMILISIFGPFRVLGAPLYTHFWTQSNSGMWHLIWKVFLKEKRCGREKEEIRDIESVFSPFKVLDAPFHTHFSINSNYRLWHLIWKVFLKEKQWNRKKEEIDIIYISFGPLRTSGPSFSTH